MASVVTAFPGRSRLKSTKYGEWLDGQAWRLVSGEDFTIGAASLRATLHVLCQRQGLGVRSSIRREGDLDVFYVQAFKKNGNGHV